MSMNFLVTKHLKNQQCLRLHRGSSDSRSVPKSNLVCKDDNRKKESLQETVNKRFKKFNCLRTTWRHSLVSHSFCFREIVVLTQIAIDSGGALFVV